MTSTDHARAKELFLAASERPEAQRAAFLESACRGDVALRQEVEDLLRFHEPRPAQWIGKYRLVCHLGEGGMGEVWEAEQETPVRRRVALKLIRAGMDSRQIVARFEAERQALAMMDHPNVAHVFDAGASQDGRPFFVMEYLQGEPITRHCDRLALPVRARLEILAAVCDGVHHAHQKGVIHRDIKPSNVLVQTVDGRAVPKVIDFGVAKAAWGGPGDAPATTAHGMLIGTPGYMSPEQAAGSGVDVDTRADVYSLGVLIYEVLVGVDPLDVSTPAEESLEEVLRRIREEDPPKPSDRVDPLDVDDGKVPTRRGTTRTGLRRQLRGDLDWIVMRALHKEREFRYPSASALAADIRRHLRNEAVQAGPPGIGYRVRKFVRRHRAGVAAGVIATMALALGSLGAMLGFVRAQREADQARRVSEVVLSTFAELNPNARGEGVASAEELLASASAQIEAELGDQPLVQARLFASLGQAYFAIGRFPQARSALDRTVALRREHLGPDDPETLGAMNELGEILWQLGDLDTSERVLKEALATQRRVLGVGHPAMARTLQHLGVVSLRKGALDPAEDLTREALAISRSARGPAHLEVATSLFWLGTIELLRSNHDSAWAFTERALEMAEATVGPDHPYMGWPLYQLGVLHSVDGNGDSAKVYYQRALQLEESALGPDHPNVAYPLHAWASLSAREGDFESALSMIQRALAINEAAFGADHAVVALSLNELGATLRSMGDLHGARAAHSRALDLLEQEPTTPAASISRTLELMSLVERAAGEEAAAMRLRARADSVSGTSQSNTWRDHEGA